MSLREADSEQTMRTCKRKELGQYIVADPEICGGQLTFKGTRIVVKDVLAMLVKGYDWDHSSDEFDGLLSHEAIAEAIALASGALIEKTERAARVSVHITLERRKKNYPRTQINARQRTGTSEVSRNAF